MSHAGPFRGGAASRLARGMRLDDPPQDVEFERYVTPDEWASLTVTCLVDQGIPAVLLPDGGVGFGNIPPEQAQAQREAAYRCSVRFPFDPRYEQPLSNEQLQILYEYRTGELAECLKSEGYIVPDPPTVEVFIESHADPGAVVWHPYPEDDPRLHDMDEWYRINEVCPQNPPLDVLYGS